MKFSCPVCSMVMGYGELEDGSWFQILCDAKRGPRCRALAHYGKAEAEMYFSEVRCPHCNRLKLWGSFPPGSVFQDMRCARCKKYFGLKFSEFEPSDPFSRPHRGQVRLMSLGPAYDLQGRAVHVSQK